jgi:hypothetical protein
VAGVPENFLEVFRSVREQKSHSRKNSVDGEKNNLWAGWLCEACFVARADLSNEAKKEAKVFTGWLATVACATLVCTVCLADANLYLSCVVLVRE